MKPPNAPHKFPFAAQLQVVSEELRIVSWGSLNTALCIRSGDVYQLLKGP